MYKIIGADGVEYGPVDTATLRQWITEGRANAGSRVFVIETKLWTTLAQLPEFADLNPPPPLSAPLLPGVRPRPDPTQFVQEVLARDYRVEIGPCVSRAWDLLQTDFWLLIGASFVGGLIAQGGGIPYIGPLIGLFIGGPMLGGLFLFLLNKIRGRTVEFGDIFKGFSLAFTPLMLAYLVSSLLTFVGILLCLLPGIYLAVSWVFAIPLVIDHGFEFWDAMEVSRKVVNKHWWAVFGFLIVIGLLAAAGFLACCVGIIVTAAIAELALMYLYEDIFGPPAHPSA